tara:strand:+ start:92 stop:430 length:339 start_codon:yes stop_codon:yes gene_type:complete
MILTDNKAIANLIGLDIVAEIADDYTYQTDIENAQYSPVDALKDMWLEEVEDQLNSYQIAQYLGRIDWNGIADDAINAAQERRDAEEEAKEYQDNPDNWIYDKETGVWDERY